MSVRARITLLSGVIALCVAAAAVTSWLQVRADENVKPADLYAVVECQLGDFRGGDFSHAYEYASQDIQSRYSVEQFAAMVREQYPSLTRVTHAEYGVVQTHRGRATMEVFLVCDDGGIRPCVYKLVREGDAWLIDGARLMQPWPPDVQMNETIL